MTPTPGTAAEITLPSDREILVTRWLDAPRDLVFTVFTEARHLREWWGPRDYEMEVREHDLRPGGAYCYVHRTSDGQEYRFTGHFREITPPSRLAMTQAFGDERPLLVEITLLEADGGTLVHNRLTFAEKAERDGMLDSGMERGMRESYERLDDLLARLG